MSKNKELVPAVKKEFMPVENEKLAVESLIGQAIQQNAPIETLQKLLEMRKELKDEFAKTEFDRAMSLFQSKCPIIQKLKVVKDKSGNPRYKYASLGSIVLQVSKALASNGLSYDFDEVKDAESVTIICKITHMLGHSKTSSFKVPIGKEEYMTDVQKYGARSTFAKRYAFCNALGILTSDEDTDGHGTDEPKSPKKEAVSVVKSHIVYLLGVLKAKTDRASIPLEIKRLTGLEFDGDLVEIKSRLEVLVQEKKDEDNTIR